MDPALQLHPEQQALTPAQEAEARRFADERIQAQLSTESVDEQEAEALLSQAYQVAGLPPPQHIRWLDGPLQTAAALVPHGLGGTSPWSHLPMTVSLSADVRTSAETSMAASVAASVKIGVEARVKASVGERVWKSIVASVEARVKASVRDSVWDDLRKSIVKSVWDPDLDVYYGEMYAAKVLDDLYASVRAYYQASLLAPYRFFDVYLAPNELRALAHFNELVSGYLLGREVAVIIRRPRMLVRDAQGRLHHPTGRCIEYADGWGF